MKLLFLILALLLVPSVLGLTSEQIDSIEDNSSSIDDDVVKDFINVIDNVDEDALGDEIGELAGDMSENTMEEMTELFEDLDDDEMKDILLYTFELSQSEIRELVDLFFDLELTQKKDEVDFTEDDLSLLFFGFKDDVLNATKEYCTFEQQEFLDADNKLSPPMQKAFEGALSNSIDAEFQDVQLWMENTLLPSQEGKDAIEQRVKECEVKHTLLLGEYDLLEYRNIVLVNSTTEKVKSAQNETEWWMWTSLLVLCAVFILSYPTIKEVVKRRGN